MSIALELEVKDQRGKIDALAKRLEEFDARCLDLERRLSQKLSEAIDETMAATPIPIPALPKALRDLGIGRRQPWKEA